MGALYNGSTGVSKTSSVGSIPAAPATKNPLIQRIFCLFLLLCFFMRSMLFAELTMFA